mgnify:CR=1 FL=1
MNATIITEDTYLDATDSYQGWCRACQEFTRDETEPDAEGYDCPACDRRTVCGAEQALLLGYVTF